MTTKQKDIKMFVQSHKLPTTDNEKFMSELVRQIQLLPVPASMEQGQLSEEQKKQIAVLFAKNLRSYGLRSALFTILLLSALWTITIIALYLGFDTATSFLQSNGIPMAETIIYTLASVTFTFPAVYILRAM